MAISLPLDKMSNQDKIAAMEELWDDLCRQPESFASPDWHQEILKAREADIKNGQAEFTSFDKAKERIQDQTK